MEQFRRGILAEVGEDTFDCWFRAIELERLEGEKLTVSVPVKFLKRWLDEHYMRPLLRGAQRMDARVEVVEIVLRKPRTAPLGEGIMGKMGTKGTEVAQRRSQRKGEDKVCGVEGTCA